MNEIEGDVVVKKCHDCDFKMTQKELLFRNIDLARHGVDEDLDYCPNCGAELEDLERLKQEIAAIRIEVEELTGVDYGVKED